jgi:hypothetical protein
MSEAAFGAQSLGVVSGSHQECSRDIGADPLEGTEIGRHLLGEAIKLRVERCDLLAEVLVASRQRSHRHLGGGGGRRDRARPQRRKCADERPAGE